MVGIDLFLTSLYPSAHVYYVSSRFKAKLRIKISKCEVNFCRSRVCFSDYLPISVRLKRFRSVIIVCRHCGYNALCDQSLPSLPRQSISLPRQSHPMTLGSNLFDTSTSPVRFHTGIPIQKYRIFCTQRAYDSKPKQISINVAMSGSRHKHRHNGTHKK